MKRNENFQETLRIVSQYLETALAHNSFVPAEPPHKALMRVRLVFDMSREQEARIIPFMDEMASRDFYALELRRILPSFNTSLTVRFRALYGYLGMLGVVSRAMMPYEVEEGQNLLEILKTLQRADRADVFFPEACARFGIYLSG